jgi:glucose/arabinose dehydrogenase
VSMRVGTVGLCFAAAACLAAGTALLAGTPPPGFTEAVVVGGGATGVVAPTALAYEPATGNLWIAEKGPGTTLGDSRVRVWNAASGQVTTARTLTCVDSLGERGILGLAFHPDYLDGPSSRWVYVYYTRRIPSTGACSIPGLPDSSRNRVSRFRESAGSLSGEEVIYETPGLTSATNHNGGAIRFGLDARLYVAIGDNDTDANPAPLSRDLGDPRGKILRLSPDGAAPADNPFVGRAGALPEIWALGLRNPFRIAVDETTGLLVIADVGENTWEEIDLGSAGADYGYPCYEGSAAFRACNPAPPAGSVTDPIFAYHHGGATPPVSGSSIIGGPVYRHVAFPADYAGAYFFADFGAGWIRRGRLTGDGRLENVQPFIPDAGQVVDLVVSPAGCLSYALYSGSVRNVCYAASVLLPPSGLRAE